jgi:hypothetical protein
MRPTLHQVRVPNLPRRKRPWPTSQTAAVSATSGFYISTAPGTLYPTLQRAVDAATAGDTILGIPGTYIPEKVSGFDWTTRITKNLTIKSSVVGQKVVIDTATVAGPGGGAIMYVTDGRSLTLEDFELVNNKVQDNYNAGLGTAVNTGTVTLRRCKIHECSNGIFNSNVDATCVLTLEDCELVNNGTSAGYYHQMYIGNITSLTLRGCWVHNTKTRDDYVAQLGAGNEWRESGGHLVKSRAKITTVEACRITMEVQSATWGANRCFDISNAGDLTIRGNYIEYRTGQNGGQGQAITWGAEGSVNLPGLAFEVGRTFKVKIQQNTIVARSDFQSSVTNQHPLWIAAGNYGYDGSSWGTQPVPAPTEFSVVDNIFCGWINNPPQVLQGGYLVYGNSGSYSVTPSATYAISGSANTCGALSLLTSAASYDYTPASPVTGSQNWMTLSYVHPTSTIARTDATRGAVAVASIAWPTSVAVSRYASVPVPANLTIRAVSSVVSSGLPDIADEGGAVDSSAIGASYSQNLTWNEDFGPGGGGLFTGGGHQTCDYAFAWVFDGSLPGWVSLALNNAGPTTYPGQALNTTYATGTEASLTPANIPGGTLIADGYYCRPQPADPSYPTPYGYPSFDSMEFGEWSTGVPFGFHSWNSIFRIPANKMGMGSKGGWGTICHHSMTRMSGKGVAWGHKIDAATGQWSRWPQRLPALSGINDMGAEMRSCVEGNYAYTKWNYGTNNGRNMVRTDLTTGAHTSIPNANAMFATNNLLIIPGTTICVWLMPVGGTQSSGTRQAIIGACDVSGSGTTQVECNMVSNTMPSSAWWDSWAINLAGSHSGFGQAGLAWVPEVGKLAAFHQAPISSVDGTWPLSLFWITPPANVQSTYASGQWTVEEEPLQVPAGDTKAGTANNRGTWGFQYNSFAWSSKLRCFLHFPRPGAGMCFFIRSNKVP